MRVVVIGIALLLMTLRPMAQRSEVTALLVKHGIDTADLSLNIKKNQEGLAFDLKYSTITSGTEKITLARYDPLKPQGSNWTVISVDGKSASATQNKRFNKERVNPGMAAANADADSLKLESETDSTLVISYTFDPAGLTGDAAFLKECRSFLSFNLKSKRLEKIHTVNEKPVKIKIVKAEKLDLTITLSYDEKLKRYLPQKEDLVLVVKMLGQLTSIETISDYSNYRKP